MIGLPIFLLSLFLGWLQVFYALYFFLVSAMQLIERGQVVYDPEHSSKSHYEWASRFNIINFSITAFIILSTFIVIYVPIDKALIVFLLWTLGLLLYNWILRKSDARLGVYLFSSYIKEQMPNTNIEVIRMVVSELVIDPNISEKQIHKHHAVSEKEAKDLKHYFETYKNQNNEYLSAEDPGALQEPQEQSTT